MDTIYMPGLHVTLRPIGVEGIGQWQATVYAHGVQVAQATRWSREYALAWLRSYLTTEYRNTCN